MQGVALAPADPWPATYMEALRTRMDGRAASLSIGHVTRVPDPDALDALADALTERRTWIGMQCALAVDMTRAGATVRLLPTPADPGSAHALIGPLGIALIIGWCHAAAREARHAHA
ncbi:hypothetical protein [Bifidobacterium samirii]|uniref:Uncharacterized protein n=1 Tax=Bifidobacterium samirii TaxID=2306974 RepID=A0A430FJM2_9BIFI|nr:hypothetical protein [Bifidobacterium samirii]RSX53000.1 hypothetical protein D2E24_1671 [Bifidobacterium samirii]